MELDINEAMRYFRMNNATDEMREQVERVANEIKSRFQPKYIYRIFQLEKNKNEISLLDSNVILMGKTAGKMLNDCDFAALLICTLGFEFDNYMRALQVKNMSDAVIADSCGSVLVESGCDKAQEEIKALMPNMFVTDRFSAGYGDLSLDVQTDIVKALNGTSRLGVHLTETMLFNPCKTVSAIIGFSKTEQAAKIRGCKYCTMRDRCEYRKVGKSCET